MSAVPMTVEQLLARVAALEEVNAKLAAAQPLINGTFNRSKPRDDGKPGSLFYGSIKIPVAVAEAACAEARANGRSEIVHNAALYENVNKATGETFLGLRDRGLYVPE